MELEALPPVSKAVIIKIRALLNLDEERTKEAVEGIKKWIEQQPHLPKTYDEGRLERWLIRCKNSMEKTKKSLDVYYSLRTVVPELMCDWDVNEQWFRDSCKDVYYIPLPKLTDDMDRITFLGLLSEEHPDLNLLHAYKLVLLVLEILMCEDYKLKDIFVTDLKHFQLSDLQKISFPLIKKLQVCVFEGITTRIRAIHYINTPTYANIIINFVKSILKDKLVSRIYVHGSDLTEFYKQVPKHLVPAEYGGDMGTIQENWDRWQVKIKSYRTWFLQQEALKSDETRRSSNKTIASELFGFEGSFRKLTID